jgi:hypothetical protein
VGEFSHGESSQVVVQGRFLVRIIHRSPQRGSPGLSFPMMKAAERSALAPSRHVVEAERVRGLHSASANGR